MKETRYYVNRTDKYLIIGYPLQYVKNTDDELVIAPDDNISIKDDSFVVVTPENINKLIDTKQKNIINFYNTYSMIGGRPTQTLVNKFRFNAKDYVNLCIKFKEYKQNDKTELRVYNSFNDIFNNTIENFEKIKIFSTWISNYIDSAEDYYINLSFYDLKYMGGTCGISFGNNNLKKIPLIIMERVDEYIKSEKIAIKTGSIQKELSGISSINFHLQPVSFVEDWLFTHNFCMFDPSSLIVQYNAYSNKYKDDEGITTITFKFVPIQSDTFYKNSSMFESQNKFFNWIISASKTRESSKDVLRSIPSIQMRLSSIEVTNNTVRESEHTANDFASELLVNLGFADNDVQVTNKVDEDFHKHIVFTFVNNERFDPKGYTNCELKAYL